MRKKTALPKILGINAFANRAFLFKFYPSKEKNTFQISTSKDGVNFVVFKKWAEIVKKNGQQEKIAKCQDFSLTKLKTLFFLLTKLKRKKLPNFVEQSGVVFLIGKKPAK